MSITRSAGVETIPEGPSLAAVLAAEGTGVWHLMEDLAYCVQAPPHHRPRNRSRLGAGAPAFGPLGRRLVRKGEGV